MKKLPLSFYQRENILQIAQELVGKVLVTNWNGKVTSGRIVELEAYNGIIDRASHAFGGRRTNRTEIMYAQGGVAYVYLCYGIHHLFNVVTHGKDVPHAILIRAIEPIDGIAEMLIRTHKKKADYTLTKGPGNVAKALGIVTAHSGYSLRSKEVFIADDGYLVSAKQLRSTVRIGVDYAGKDAFLPYRFYLKDNLYVSGKLK